MVILRFSIVFFSQKKKVDQGTSQTFKGQPQSVHGRLARTVIQLASTITF